MGYSRAAIMDKVPVVGKPLHLTYTATDHVPLEAMNIELSRQESVSRL